MNAKNTIPNEEITTTTHHPDYKSEIIEILRSNLAPQISKDHILAYHENDIATAMEFMTPDERKELYSILDLESLSSVLEYSENTSKYINELSMRTKIAVFSCMETSTAVECLKSLDKQQSATILYYMDEETKSKFLLFNSFDEDEIGSRMTTNFISVKSGSSIKAAMKTLVAQAAENDNIMTLYVVEEDNTLLGAIDLKDLITAREGTDLASITKTSFPYVYANEMIDVIF